MLEVMNGVRNMAVKFTSVKCPDCGAVLPIEEGRNQVFCSYCGSKIIMTNENEYVYRHIDEAEIKQAETERILKLKKMEMIEKKNEEAAKIKRIKIKLTIVFRNIVGNIYRYGICWYKLWFDHAGTNMLYNYGIHVVVG